MFMSKVRLRTSERGGTGALAAFLAGASDRIGQAHQIVWSLFGDKEGKRDFLYRLTGTGPSEPILIYSPEAVDDRHGLWDVATSRFVLANELSVGDRLIWSIRVNATIKVGSQRHDVVMHARRGGDQAHWDDIAQRTVPPWMETKLAAAGLEAPALAMMVEAYTRRRFAHDPRSRGQAVTIATTDLRGTGTVTNSDALRAALLAGIGSGRAYGCGMLLIRRAS
jgi:CRISPR system Cascade subunit CasE